VQKTPERLRERPSRGLCNIDPQGDGKVSEKILHKEASQ
jgi:hypothetical protein